ncbi:MAG: hypothetical protein ACTSO9_10130 [Candidatus Helarchaeota archaeon]
MVKRNTVGILFVLIGVGLGILGVALTQGEISDQNFLFFILLVLGNLDSQTLMILYLLLIFMKQPMTWYLIWAGLILSGVGGIICAVD